MQIGIVSDIHCNAVTLSAALARLADVDLLLCAGDMMDQYRFSDDVAGLLQEAGAVAILGNHEKIVLSYHGARVRERQGTAEHWAWLGAQPAQRRLNVDGWRLLLAHGAPWDDANDLSCQYLYPTDVTRLRRLPDYEADLIVLGHTHYPLLQQHGPTLVINPGSCGEARDRGLLTYGLIDTEARSASIVRLDASHEGEVLTTLELSTPTHGARVG